ncbi:hypothetical protein AYO45_01615 [Gammaproteobacteria bacterium SCGC AG-212-F23]|nr:hypothetical protein AYO45_01615 [Gammaproteobacteria bacterium SCGC AG-212-F23]
MKKYIILLLLSIIFTLSINSLAKNNAVYTIGAYDEAFKTHNPVTKFGPVTASEIPPTLPKTFLEKDGNYGGGEAFRTIKAACDALKHQLTNGILPNTYAWHIYLLDANWKPGTYQLHPNDYRIKQTVRVLKLVKETC